MLTRQVLFMIFAFIVSFTFTFATTPLVRRFAFKIGAIDIPKDNRRMHKKPTPRIGGLAIIFGFTVATLCFAQPSRQLYGTLAGAAIIAVMGVIDDCKNLPAKLKFVIQIIAALVVVFAGDIKIDVFTNPNFLSDNPYWVLPEWLSVTLTVIWIVFITNAVNFIDGLDGLAAGVSAIMSISLVIYIDKSGMNIRLQFWVLHLWVRVSDFCRLTLIRQKYLWVIQARHSWDLCLQHCLYKVCSRVMR